MKVIVCLDDFDGMMFNHRRQSRDRTVIADIAEMIGDSPLYMCTYSATLFEDVTSTSRVMDDFLDHAKRGDWCFVEDRSLTPYAAEIDTVVVYRWNRHYPSDFIFDLDLETCGFCLKDRAEFSGYSHEMITKEIFKK